MKLVSRVTVKVSALAFILFLFACAPGKESVKEEQPPPSPKVEAPLPVSAEIPPEKPVKALQPTVPAADKQQQLIKAAPEGEDKYIVLNFDDADLEVVLQTISELVGLNYILGPRVKGKITIQTYKKIPRSDLLTVLHSILEVNGFTTVQSGHYVKIIPSGEAKQYPIETRVGKDEAEIASDDVVVTQIIPLEYIAVDEMAGIIKPLVSRSGTLITHKSTNIMILSEVSSNIKRLMKIINMMDQPTQLDLGEKVFVYYVENGDAETLAGILNKVYEEKTTQKEITKVIQPVTTSAKKTRTRTQRRKQIITKGEGISSSLEGEINIVSAKEINALIIKTTPRNYKVVLELLKKIDIMPRQVLIEVLIADITLSDDFSFGLEWEINNASQKIGGSKMPLAQTTGFFPAGSEGVGGILTYVMQQGDIFKSTIAAQAKKGNVNVLSSPHILTTDNQEASIAIVDQIPISTYTSDPNTLTSYSSVQYKDAGITLKVTPKINDKGLVSMKISLNVSDVGEKTYGGETSFLSRDASTSVVVQSGQTLVIGGLIKESQRNDRSGIPFLMDIPVIGYLFGTVSKTVNKTELVMLITPHVVTSGAEVDELTEKYQRDVDKLRKHMKGDVN